MLGARLFVAVSFILLGATFIASSALFIHEFQSVDWFTLLVAHSYLFFFFPVLGLLALSAFYLPSVVFTHLYWTHLPFGKVRFLAGLVLVMAAAWGFAKYLDKPPRSIWEVSPGALIADKGDAGAGRVSILGVLADLREKAQTRVGLSSFARPCVEDPLMEEAAEMAKKRYCFPAQTNLAGAACCKAQAEFAKAVERLQQNPATRSLSAQLDAMIFLPLKVFFVLIVVAIGALLALWRDRIDQHYRELVPRLERGIIIGAFAMLFWPAMDYGFQQTANVLFGRMDAGPQLRLSLVIAPWALLLLFYFLRRLGKQGEMIGQISGVVVAAVAVLRYEQLNDWVGRLFGIGADRAILVAQVGLAVVGLVALLWLRRTGRYPQQTATAA
ncbi:MAG: hypothetical protein K2X43_15225 [Hyphomonadaceae bacterium]|jgi:hypothetical protein|nr:hypothetical protein [Hyphomonadaceae bacterium]